MEDEKTDRLRQHPDQRFAAPQHQFDLAVVAAKLAQEVEAGEAGHRQEVLYKNGPTSISLFLFGHLSRLPPHRAKGIVSIQVLKGHLRVMAEGQSHDLRSGSILILANGIQHDVVAQQESEMLLTVNLEPSTGASSPA